MFIKWKKKLSTLIIWNPRQNRLTVCPLNQTALDLIWNCISFQTILIYARSHRYLSSQKDLRMIVRCLCFRADLFFCYRYLLFLLSLFPFSKRLEEVFLTILLIRLWLHHFIAAFKVFFHYCSLSCFFQCMSLKFSLFSDQLNFHFNYTGYPLLFVLKNVCESYSTYL